MTTAQIPTGLGAPDAAPLSVVIGQMFWNAAQVGGLATLLSLWLAHRRWWIAALAVATMMLLPFAIYVTSPGAWALAALLLGTSAMAWTSEALDLGVEIVEVPPRDGPAVSKLELLAFVCYLLSSLYNYNASRTFWPYWSSLYAGGADLIGFTTTPAAIAQFMYTLGLQDVGMPSWLTAGRNGSNVGAVVFLSIWTVLPFLYILYFAAMAALARHSPGARIQQALCLFAIFHFLFLTDLVAYQYGRGTPNALAEWAHWSERWVWRIAILLPIYQKVTTGQLLRSNGKLGVALHYGLAAWGLGFLIYQVAIYDVVRFYQFASGAEVTYFEIFGLHYRQEIGYHGALVLMTLLSAFMVLAMRSKRMIVAPVKVRLASASPLGGLGGPSLP